MGGLKTWFWRNFPQYHFFKSPQNKFKDHVHQVDNPLEHRSKSKRESMMLGWITYMYILLIYFVVVVVIWIFLILHFQWLLYGWINKIMSFFLLAFEPRGFVWVKKQPIYKGSYFHKSMLLLMRGRLMLQVVLQKISTPRCCGALWLHLHMGRRLGC